MQIWHESLPDTWNLLRQIAHAEAYPALSLVIIRQDRSVLAQVAKTVFFPTVSAT